MLCLKGMSRLSYLMLLLVVFLFSTTELRGQHYFFNIIFKVNSIFQYLEKHSSVLYLLMEGRRKVFELIPN